MRTIMTVVCLATLAGPSCAADPTIVGVPSELPNGNTQWTFSIDWNDSATASGYFALSASSDNIYQLRPFGILSINTYDEVTANWFIDPGYDPHGDSWWYTGPGTPWTAGTPPFGGVDIASGLPGSNTYRASYGSDPNQPLFGSTLILQLVTNDPEGDVSIYGTIARLGEDYTIDQHFTAVVPEPATLALSGLGFGALAFACRRRWR